MENSPQTIYDLGTNKEKDEKRKNIIKSVFALSKSSHSCDTLIKDYMNLYQKYQKIYKKEENSQKDIEGKENEIQHSKTYNDKITTLEKRNEELNQLLKMKDTELMELKKKKQNLENDHNDLLESNNKMLMEIEILRNQVLELKQKYMNQINDYNELIEREKDNKDPNSICFFEKYHKKIHNKPITSISFSKSGKYYATTGGDYSMKAFNGYKNTEESNILAFNGSVVGAEFDHKNHHYIFGGSLDKSAKLWDFKSNKIISVFNEHTDYINCVKCFNTKSCGLTGSSDNTIKEWDFNTKTMTKEYKCEKECHSLEISTDDKMILSGDINGVVKLWNSNDKPEKIFNLHDDKVLQIKMVNNFQMITLGKDKIIKLFDIRKEEDIFKLDKNQIPQFCESNICLSPDKKYFAVASNQGIVYIINLKEGKVETIFNNKTNFPISSLYWNSNNNQIYIGDVNGFITIWGKYN